MDIYDNSNDRNKMKRLIKFLRDMDAGSAEIILNNTTKYKSSKYLIEGKGMYTANIFVVEHTTNCSVPFSVKL